jgi:hypothetical protein
MNGLARRRSAVSLCVILLISISLHGYPWRTRSLTDDKQNVTYLLDINAAPRDELLVLPGIGPTLAQRIIDRRRQRGFTDLRDLETVHGIGPKTVARLTPYLRFPQPPCPDVVNRFSAFGGPGSPAD